MLLNNFFGGSNEKKNICNQRILIIKTTSYKNKKREFPQAIAEFL
jgi:hypothetical protein